MKDCAIVAAGGALLLSTKKKKKKKERKKQLGRGWGLKFLPHFSNIASGRQKKINNSKIRPLFLQIRYDYSHVTNNYCKHCP